MDRSRRRQSARHWLATQRGRSSVQIAKAYRKRFGVDWPCALQELASLGIHLDAEWVANLRRTLDGALRSRARMRELRAQAEAETAQPDANAQFAFIAGYTENGVPFGVTWEEWSQQQPEATGGESLSGEESETIPRSERADGS